MKDLIPVREKSDILSVYQNTAIGSLLEYHNLEKPFGPYSNAEILVGMCMDHRKKLNIPDNFAYIIRTGGANLRYSEFKVSYAIAVGGIKAIALIGHNHCGMVNLDSKKDKFIEGLVNRAGWDEAMADQHFSNYAPLFEIGNEVDFLLTEAKRLRERYPKILIAPLYYKLEDNLLYQVRES